MPMRFAAVVLAVLLLPGAALAQAPKPPPVSAPPAVPPPAREATKTYLPGLEQFMGVIQNQHAKLWYAGQAKNWELAAYQLGELKEVMSDVQDLIPTFKSLPLDKMLDAVIVKEIAELEKAVDAKDSKKFAAGFDALTRACNACHQGTGNGFIVIQRPHGTAFPNQDFRPR